MFAVGAFAGLRTGESSPLEWSDLDLAARTIHVQRSEDGPLKDNDGGVVPMPETLAKVGAVLRAALAAAELPEGLRAIRWYEATRHHGARAHLVDVDLAPAQVLPLPVAARGA